MKILFVTGEAFPLMKTGGLGDVCGSLPPALNALGGDVRLLMPAYRDAKLQAQALQPIAQLTLPPLSAPVTLLETTLPSSRVPVWLVDFPPAFDRPGNPYMDEHGNSWPDNAARFALLARTAAAIARHQAGLSWQPDIVHCHDWQAGLVPALLARESSRPATIFTVHNLAYQGVFPPETLGALGLPSSWWSFDALEFHGQLSFIKGGLAFADWITTVSPTYAREIQTPAFGEGLDGLLSHRAARLVGILNGIDSATWNPARDRDIAARYSARSIQNKARNKQALQHEFGLTTDARTMLMGTVGRMVHQKGMDLTIAALPQLMQRRVQFVALGTGDRALEQALRAEAARFPGRCTAMVGYDEALAHRIIAGVDAFLMPSRFEPCGLSQLYSLRYGTVPIVRRVGGLADTVKDGETGIGFDEASSTALVDAVTRALALHHNGPAWRKLMAAGMRQDFSWRHSAGDYLRLYRDALRG